MDIILLNVKQARIVTLINIFINKITESIIRENLTNKLKGLKARIQEKPYFKNGRKISE